MPEPKFRSRSYKRKQTKLPGGNTVKTYEKNKPKTAGCANCGKSLKGIARERPYRMKKLGVSKKRPERPFGGYLCSDCSRELIKKEARE